MSERKPNEEQQKIIDCKDNKIVCIAGAGSGKTFTMIERIDRLVSEGVDPTSILVLTFTNAAALEMKTRYLKKRTNTSRLPNFRTFHSFCYNLLCTDRDVLYALGYETTPVISDESMLKRLSRNIKRDLGIKLSDNMLASTGFLTPKQEYERSRYNEMLKKKLISDNKITFDVLCNSVCNLFINDDESISKYKSMYDYIFVDEFQDTDPKQWKFVKSFENANIFVCGDIAQAIYGFRDADSSIMTSLIDSKDYTKLYITHNYRSTIPIVNFANKVVTSNDSSCKFYAIQMTSDKKGPFINEVIIPYKNPDSRKINPIAKQKLLDWIAEIKKNPLDHSVALLTKTNTQADDLRDILTDQNIEFSNNNSGSDIPYFLRSVSDNEYMISWVSTFLPNEAYATYLRFETVGYPNPDISKYANFYDRFKSYPQVRYRIDTVIKLRKILRNKDLSITDKLSNVFALLEIKNVMLNDIDLPTSMKEMLPFIEKTCQEISASNIYVGTIHSVKGLEYDEVQVFGVDESSFKLSKDENNNVYYVAVTRAKEYLTVYRYDDRYDRY